MQPKNNLFRLSALLSAVFFVAGCSGGMLPNGVPSQLGAGVHRAAHNAARSASGRARFQIRIPRRTRHRRPHYISPNTQSMTISINNKKIGTYSLMPSAKGCSTIDGATQCSFTIGIPSGKTIFSVATYASADGSGTALSQGSVTRTIKAGQMAVIPLTLSGVVSSIAVSLGNASPPAGAAATTPVYVTAYDASGAAIVGPGNYGTPITLTDSDTSGITTLSSTTVNGPAAKVSLTYSGHSLLSASIGASAAGIPATSITGATFAPVPRILASYTIPSAVGNGSAALAITGGPDGNVWYTTELCNSCGGGGVNYGNDAIVDMTTTGTVIASYVAGTTPNLAKGAFNGITKGPDGKLWFTDTANKKIGSITTSGTVTEYTAPGGICPNRIIAGPSGDNGLWFTSTCSDSIGHITTAGVGTAYSLSGGGTVYESLVLGKDGNIYVVDLTNKAIGQAVISGGAVSSYSEVVIPANPVDGSANTGLFGIAQTADGELWFSNDGCSPSTIGSIAIASPFTSSTISQYVTKQGCSYPAEIAVTPDGSTAYLAEWDYPVIEQITPAGAGKAPTLTDYAIQAVTPNTVFQETYDITVGPDGNVWSTIYTNDYSNLNPANVVEMAY
jgi:virginiamycin B lyase